MDFELARFNMIEQQIRPWKVLDQAVLDVLARVRREDFVPPEWRALAFADVELPLKVGHHDTHEVMLTPKVEARLLQALALQKHESVLEIGAGSGFMAALLGLQARHVDTLEIHPELARFAQDNLLRAGLGNVTVRHADGADPTATPGHYGAIMVSGAVAQVPESLLNRVAPHGRLVAIVGELPLMRAQLFTRGIDADWHTETLFETVAPALHGFAPPTSFKF